MACRHLWIYRRGRSECLRCHATADDGRGLPHGHYAVNGAALSAGRLRDGFACPTCLADINPRIVDGKLRVLCAGENAHDIAVMGRALPKAQRDAILDKQRQDYYEVIDNLPDFLKEVIKCQLSV